MESAKPMVKLANQITRKIKEKQGDVSDDETVRFKSYLMSLGISNPVTREEFGSGQTYFKQFGHTSKLYFECFNTFNFQSLTSIRIQFTML